MTSKKYHHYSGKNSIKFWDRVNKIKGVKGEALYTLGVVLQNLEEDVLHKVELYEQDKEKEE
jgi:hypothetical protein